MAFNSIPFLLFASLLLPCFFICSDRWRWLVLLAASLMFYAWLFQPMLLIALAVVVLVSYGCGIGIEALPVGRSKKIWYVLGLSLNLAVLALLKYLPFVGENLRLLAKAIGLSQSGWLGQADAAFPQLPFIGVSYFVFQAISYLTDLYYGQERAERHLGIFALYLAFFPKLLQGPIERASSLLPQLHQPFEFDYDRTRRGLLLFAWGLYKKVAVADRLALFVNPVYSHAQALWCLPLLLATYLYAFQIFCDFSGYTDMAIGLGLVFGIRLSPNFNAPYLARSVAEYWRRWHMSFSGWIRDYLFDPMNMGLRRWGTKGLFISLLLAFSIVGLWHGASWHFVVWGALNGAFMVFALATAGWRKRLRSLLGLEKSRLLPAIQIALTFHLVCFSLIFFRADSLTQAMELVAHLAWGPGVGNDWTSGLLLGQSLSSTLIMAATLGLVPLVYVAQKRIDFFGASPSIRWAAYYALSLLILWCGLFYAPKQFIYFQF